MTCVLTCTSNGLVSKGQGKMKVSDFLRRQAEACVALSRATFDLTMAGRLRTMAAEFQIKATELDDEVRRFPTPILLRRGSPDGERELG